MGFSLFKRHQGKDKATQEKGPSRLSGGTCFQDPSVEMNRKPAKREPGAPVYPNDGLYGGGGAQWGGPGGQVGAGMQVGGSFAG